MAIEGTRRRAAWRVGSIAAAVAGSAIVQAAGRLESAGSFSYAGTSRATDVTPTWVAAWGLDPDAPGMQIRHES